MVTPCPHSLPPEGFPSPAGSKTLLPSCSGHMCVTTAHPVQVLASKEIWPPSHRAAAAVSEANGERLPCGCLGCVRLCLLFTLSLLPKPQGDPLKSMCLNYVLPQSEQPKINLRKAAAAAWRFGEFGCAPAAGRRRAHWLAGTPTQVQLPARQNQSKQLSLPTALVMVGPTLMHGAVVDGRASPQHPPRAWRLLLAVS